MQSHAAKSSSPWVSRSSPSRRKTRTRGGYWRNTLANTKNFDYSAALSLELAPLLKRLRTLPPSILPMHASQYLKQLPLINALCSLRHLALSSFSRPFYEWLPMALECSHDWLPPRALDHDLFSYTLIGSRAFPKARKTSTVYRANPSPKIAVGVLKVLRQCFIALHTLSSPRPC
jgi:hypothetical protein